nr:hypothetical protein [uncultured Draconibacterium sp.]
MKKSAFQNIRYSNVSRGAESPLFGLFEGKKKSREAAAREKVLAAEKEKELALIEAKNKQLLLQLEAAKQGYNPEKEKAQAAVELEKTQAVPEITLYSIIGVIVLVVMVGVVLIKRN